MSGPGVNGYLLCGVLVPEEVLIHLASFADAETLVRCRLVCRVWRELVDDHVWRRKLQREGRRYRSGAALDPGRELPWLVYYSVFSRDPYGRNLLKNPCGEDSFKHWGVLLNGGDHFVVENGPVGADPVPEAVGSQHCFVTSYGYCGKEQWVNLAAEGIPPRVMDEVRPAIVVSDWYANRFDCPAFYDLQVGLCDSRQRPLKTGRWYKQMMNGENMSWRQMRKVFVDYPAGVRYVHFYHRGKDSWFWAGHYGVKMTGSSVSLTLLEVSEELYTLSSAEDNVDGDYPYAEED